MATVTTTNGLLNLVSLSLKYYQLNSGVLMVRFRDYPSGSSETSKARLFLFRYTNTWGSLS